MFCVFNTALLTDFVSWRKCALVQHV